MTDTTTATEAPPKISYTVREAEAATGLSRTALFEAAREKLLTMRRGGRRNIIEADELSRYVKTLPTTQAAA
jgi:hypothetical protein